MSPSRAEEPEPRHVVTLRPVGYARTPYREKAEAPRQPLAARGVEGRVEVFTRYRDGLADLEGFDRILLTFGFDRAPPTSSLKVQPPRSPVKRGVFATRSPHRPNGLGLSVVGLARVEDCTLHVFDVDLLDGTPVYDIKPYLAYTDAFPDARAGWLAEGAPADVAARGTPADPRAPYVVSLRPEAKLACEFVERETGLALEQRAREHLSLGPEPHAYRRIRREGDVSVLAVKEWRVAFVEVGPRALEIVRVRSGCSPRDLARDRPDLAAHRAFVARFGA